MAALAGPSPPPVPAPQPVHEGGAMASGGAQQQELATRVEEAGRAPSVSPASPGGPPPQQQLDAGPSREAGGGQGESPGEQTHAYFSEQVLAAGILELHHMPGLPQVGPKYKCAAAGAPPTVCSACPPPLPQPLTPPSRSPLPLQARARPLLLQGCARRRDGAAGGTATARRIAPTGGPPPLVPPPSQPRPSFPLAARRATQEGRGVPGAGLRPLAAQAARLLQGTEGGRGAAA